jgi:hypothetical protein
VFQLSRWDSLGFSPEYFEKFVIRVFGILTLSWGSAPMSSVTFRDVFSEAIMSPALAAKSFPKRTASIRVVKCDRAFPWASPIDAVTGEDVLDAFRAGAVLCENKDKASHVDLFGNVVGDVKKATAPPVQVKGQVKRFHETGLTAKVCAEELVKNAFKEIPAEFSPYTSASSKVPATPLSVTLLVTCGEVSGFSNFDGFDSVVRAEIPARVAVVRERELAVLNERVTELEARLATSAAPGKRRGKVGNCVLPCASTCLPSLLFCRLHPIPVLLLMTRYWPHYMLS